MRKTDTLVRHQKNYEQYEQRYNTSVSLLQGTVRELEELGHSMDEEIAQIEAHMAELEQTRNHMTESRARNGKVVKNFKALLCID